MFLNLPSGSLVLLTGLGAFDWSQPLWRKIEFCDLTQSSSPGRQSVLSLVGGPPLSLVSADLLCSWLGQTWETSRLWVPRAGSTQVVDGSADWKDLAPG